MAEMQTQHGQIEIGGTLQQKLSSCFEVLDQLLIQNEPVVSSMVVAEKRAFGSADNPVQYVANMLGKNLFNKRLSVYKTICTIFIEFWLFSLLNRSQGFKNG